jgi:hypothetical protein
MRMGGDDLLTFLYKLAVLQLAMQKQLQALHLQLEL